MNTDNLSPLEKDLLDRIIRLCQIEELPDQVDPDDYLIGKRSVLGLDSLDAIEIVVEIQKIYDVTFGPMEKSYNTLANLRNLAEYIGANTPSRQQ